MGDDHRAKRQVDFIIVGQGLAGTLLAHDLLEKGHSVYIIDKPLIASASKVAAGLINPVGMKRCIPSWQADVFLPFAFKRYQSLEKKLQTSFFTQKPIYRLFANTANRKEWQIKHSNEGMDQYITDFEYASSQPFLKDEIAANYFTHCILRYSSVFKKFTRLFLATKMFGRRGLILRG